MEKENVRFYIKVRHALGIDALTIYEELRSYAGEMAPSHSTVKRWCKLFRRGRELLVDDPRSGRPYSKPAPSMSVQVDCLDLTRDNCGQQHNTVSASFSLSLPPTANSDCNYFVQQPASNSSSSDFSTQSF